MRREILFSSLLAVAYTACQSQPEATPVLPPSLNTEPSKIESASTLKPKLSLGQQYDEAWNWFGSADIRYNYLLGAVVNGDPFHGSKEDYLAADNSRGRLPVSP